MNSVREEYYAKSRQCSPKMCEEISIVLRGNYRHLSVSWRGSTCREWQCASVCTSPAHASWVCYLAAAHLAVLSACSGWHTHTHTHTHTEIPLLPWRLMYWTSEPANVTFINFLIKTWYRTPTKWIQSNCLFIVQKYTTVSSQPKQFDWTRGTPWVLI